MALDVSVPYWNTVLSIFDDPMRVTRSLQGGLITQSLVDRWIIEDRDSRPVGSPFWLTVDGSPDPLDLGDLLAFIGHGPPFIEGDPPSGSLWMVTQGVTRAGEKIAGVTELERLAFLDAISNAASKWSFQHGRVTRGLDEILTTVRGVVSWATHPAASQYSTSFVGSKNNLFQNSTRDAEVREQFTGVALGVVQSLSEFNVNRQNWPDVKDFGDAVRKLTEFFSNLALPPTPRVQSPEAVLPREARSKLQLAMVKLAARAHELFISGFHVTEIDGRSKSGEGNPFERRGYFDFIDGDLLPWALLHHCNAGIRRGDNPLSWLDPMTIAFDRFGLESLRSVNGLEEHLCIFSWDIREPVEGEDICPDRKGCYSSRLAWSYFDSLSATARYLGMDLLRYPKGISPSLVWPIEVVKAVAIEPSRNADSMRFDDVVRIAGQFEREAA